MKRLDCRGMAPRPSTVAAWLALFAVTAACTSSSKLPSPPPPACTPPSPQPSSFSSSATLAARVIDLGVHPVNDTVTFHVPAGTASVTILEQESNALAAQTVSINGQTFANTTFPHSITVGETQIFDVYGDAINPDCNPPSVTCQNPTTLSVYYFSDAAWAGALTIPNTPAMLSAGVPPGTWSMVVSDYANECPHVTGCSTVYAYPAGSYQVTVLLKPGPAPASGAIDFTFYLLTNAYQAAAQNDVATRDPNVSRMLSTLGTLLGGAGISLGATTFVDLPDSVKAKYLDTATSLETVDADDVSACGQVAELLRNSGPGNAMNLFLVDRITTANNPAGTSTVGLDGTIPGPATVGGTVSSGALASAANLSSGCNGPIRPRTCGPDEVAYIAAHETGHFLGLYHPTESDGTWFDPLTDTDICPCSSCAPPGSTCQNSSSSVASPYAMAGTDCVKSSSCGGGDNLMFWELSGASVGTLSSQQGEVMRANSLVQ